VRVERYGGGVDRAEVEQTRVELEEFCRREYTGLVRTLSLYCGDRETAEDLAQETLARVWRRWDRVVVLDRPELWARRVALNLANSWFRRQRLILRFPPMRPAHDGSDRLESDAEFARAVAGLPARQRAVLILRFYEDRSIAETAGLMGVREGTVRALSHQALTRIRAEHATVEGESS
jgi:RNA polymerase sigma-70 factor (sigma-E family)